MPDYIFLLGSRLSPEQRAVLERVQELSISQDVNVYLTGGAVRDLISGQPIRDLDFTIEGNPARMVRELEKGGARTTWESERLHHYEMIFAGDVDGSISAARDDYYERPGAKPEYRLASVMEDLHRRDFSINAIAISLNSQSRGLLLDPMNGLADLERQEMRVLSIHSFTNQPVRLLRILRYCARMGFKIEQRTQEWFDLAIERGLHQNIPGADLGDEVRGLTREENPAATLKQWEARGMLALIHPQLQRRKPDYEGLNKLARVRANLMEAGLRPRLRVPVTYFVFSRLKSREAAGTLRNLELRATEVEAVTSLVPEAQKIIKVLKGRKMATPRDAYCYIASLPLEMLAFIETELPNPRAVSKIRSYIQKWRPLHLALPVGELDALGIPRGPKFDKILEQLFEMQLRGRGRTPEDRTKILRQLAGIKEEPKKVAEKGKRKGKGKDETAHEAKHHGKGAHEATSHVAQSAASGTHVKSEASRNAASAIGAKAKAKHDKAAASQAGKKHSSGGAKRGARRSKK
jgi:tRNA nucleotidyltransferase/poly(A) polymerase